MGRRRLKPRLVGATLLLGLSAVAVDAAAGGTCSAERPREIFAALEKIDEAGEAQELKTGDSFMIPNGFCGYWEVLETTTKHLVIRHY